MDHDQRFKTLIREFFYEFLLLFFSDWAARLDLTQLEWLEQELFHDPPEGKRKTIDLLARVAFQMPDENELQPTLILVHIEIESADRATDLKSRMSYYYHNLREKHQLKVLPIVIDLKVAMDGIGVDSVVESIGDFEVNRFRYLYVGLPGLEAVEYVYGDNWLGVALTSLMRIPTDQVVSMGAEALRRLAGANLSDQQRFLLGDCLQSYLPLTEPQQREFNQLLHSPTFSEVQAMNKTSYDQGLEQGIEQGIERGRRDGQQQLISLLLVRKFGWTTERALQLTKNLNVDQLGDLLIRIDVASSADELGLDDENKD